MPSHLHNIISNHCNTVQSKAPARAPMTLILSTAVTAVTLVQCVLIASGKSLPTVEQDNYVYDNQSQGKIVLGTT